MPTMFMLSALGLCESLVTFLLTMAMYLAVRTRGSDPSKRWLWAALAGLFLGLAQLVRVDSLFSIPAVLAVLGLTAASWRERWQSWVLCLGVAALCFAPWAAAQPASVSRGARWGIAVDRSGGTAAADGE
jgi:4-amino-4-deoxy-L-arabinose transferase-like glycosyltransferase